MNDSEQPGARQSGLTGSGETPGAPASRRSARPNKFWRFVRWTFAVGFCLILVAAGVVVKKLGSSKTILDVATHIPLADVFRGNPLASYTPANYLPNYPHTFNLLLLGCDHDYIGKRDKNGDAISIPVMSSNGRSDAIMIAHYDFDKRTISVMTIPRDTAVHFPEESARKTHKINAAHSAGGPELTQATIKDSFGIDTDAYVTLHFEAFQKIVDTVGGVKIDVKKTMNYDDNWAGLHIHLKPGEQMLTGYQAMGYVRIRHDDNDLMRAERQHEFLEALRNQIKTPATLLRAGDILDTVADNLHMSSNMDPKTLVALANWTRELPKEKITLVTMPSIEGRSFIYCNQKLTRKMVAQIFFNGDENAVAINAPEKEALYASVNRGSRRRRGRAHNDSSDASSGPDTNDTTSSDKPEHSDSSGSAPKSDSGSEQKSDGSGDHGKDNTPPSSPASAIAQLAALSFA